MALGGKLGKITLGVPPLTFGVLAPSLSLTMSGSPHEGENLYHNVVAREGDPLQTKQ